MTTPLLELRGLAGGYPPISVFRNINLTITGSQSIGLFGPNGHGKTALLKTVAGLLDPWEGDILIDGQRLNLEGKMPPRPSRYLNYDLFRKRRVWARDIVRAGVVYVMQGNTLFPEMTVKEVIEIAPSAAMGRSGVKQMQVMVDELFPRLRERWNSEIRFLSGGERQMVSIAVGLLAVPRLLILDEPTLGLSPKLRLELCAAIESIRAAKIPMLIVDQNVEFLTRLTERIYLFNHGSITGEIKGSEMPSHEEIMTMMFEEGADGH